MAKIDSNDELRIREVQQAQRDAEIRNRESDRARRNERSFLEAMTDRSAREQGERSQRQGERRVQDEGQAKRVLEQIRRRQPQTPHERAKRAALAQAMAGKQSLTRRAREGADAVRVLDERAEHHQTSQTRDREHVDERQRDEEFRSAVAGEERLEEARRDIERLAIAEDRPRGRSDREGGQSEPGSDSSAEVVEGLTPTKGSGSTGPALAPEMLERIVSALLRVAEDGRSSLVINLKGPGLEGVQIEVRNDDGAVSCFFSGCSDRLRRDLERSTEGLGQALAHRGLRLEHLEAR